MWNDGPVYTDDGLEALGGSYLIANTHLGQCLIWRFGPIAHLMHMKYKNRNVDLQITHF